MCGFASCRNSLLFLRVVKTLFWKTNVSFPAHCAIAHGKNEVFLGRPLRPRKHPAQKTVSAKPIPYRMKTEPRETRVFAISESEEKSRDSGSAFLDDPSTRKSSPGSARVQRGRDVVDFEQKLNEDRRVEEKCNDLQREWNQWKNSNPGRKVTTSLQVETARASKQFCQRPEHGQTSGQ
jgi:hypothetical protein